MKIILSVQPCRVCPYCNREYALHEIETSVRYDGSHPDIEFRAICYGGCVLEAYPDTEYASEIDERKLDWKRVRHQSPSHPEYKPWDKASW